MSEPGGSALGHALRPARTRNPLGHRRHQEGVLHAGAGCVWGGGPGHGSRQAVAGGQERGHAGVGGPGFGKDVSRPSEGRNDEIWGRSSVKDEENLEKQSREGTACVLAAPSASVASRARPSLCRACLSPHLLAFQMPFVLKIFFLYKILHMKTQRVKKAKVELLWLKEVLVKGGGWSVTLTSPQKTKGHPGLWGKWFAKRGLGPNYTAFCFYYY